MTLAEICFLPVSFIFGMIRYFGGWVNVSKTADLKPSGLGTGWICVILLVIVAAIFFNENRDRIWQFLLKHGFGILLIALIFVTLYPKANFSGWVNVSKTADLTTSGLGTGLICVILLVIVSAIFFNENSDRIWHFLRKYGFGIVSIALIFITLYLKRNFIGSNNVSTTAALVMSGLGTELICVILVFVTVIYPLSQQQ